MRSLTLLLFLSAAMPAPGQAPATPPATPELPKELMPNQQAFLNLPKEKRDEFAKHLMDAERCFRQQRVFETLGLLDKCDGVFKDSPETLNLRGSCQVEFRAFDKAMAYYQQALKLTPDNPSVLFNIGEVYFVMREWQKSLDFFNRSLEKVPADQPALVRLMNFKSMLCLKKLGRDEDAAKLADKYPIDDDSPFYCFAQAALAYGANQQLDAETWLARAGRIFRQADLAPWQDTLVEFGYIKSFYGGTGGDAE